MQKNKNLLRKAISNTVYLSRIPLLLSKGKTIILMYHRVLNEQQTSNIQPAMYVTTHVFEEHIKYLVSHFKIISFQKFLHVLKNSAIENNKRYCIITFDDGWRDNFINAYPILKKYNIPATIFLSTSYIGTTNWFWPDRITFLLNSVKMLYHSDNSKHNLFRTMKEYGIEGFYRDLNHNSSLIINNSVIEAIIEGLKTKSESQIESLIERLQGILSINFPQERLILSWQEISEMSRHDISFGSHTCNHVILTKLLREEINYQIQDSRNKIMKHKINFIPVLAYPNGNYNDIVIEETKRVGYEAALTTEFGFNDEKTDPYKFKRIGIHNDITSTVPKFSCHILGIFHPFIIKKL
ncbi:MAG: polysaccharide deacetylase family protein [Candidatus Hodarchaeota archaeon]